MTALRGRRALWALVAAYAALAVAWAMTNTPFAAPDESEHYIRAVGITTGSLLGTPARDPNPVLTPKQRVWTNQAARLVRVPAGLAPTGRFAVGGSGPGTAITSDGTYQPLPYLLPAAALSLANAHHAGAADRLARFADLLPWLALLIAAALALWEPAAGARSLTGLLITVTPMVVFVGSSLTGSGLEIAGSVAFTGALIGLTRDPARGRLWALAGVAGAVTALSRTPAPLWVVGDLVLWLAWAGRKRALDIWRAAPAAARAASAAVLSGLVLNRVWEAAHGPHLAITLIPGPHSVTAGIRELTWSLDELVGRFGSLDVGLPAWLIAAWALVGGVTLALALRHARPAFALTSAAVLLAPVYLFAATLRHTGFGLQGRHYLALWAGLALLCAETATRGRRGRELAAAAGALAAIGQLTAWWVNSHHNAVGSGGPFWFPAHAHWSPPAGWWPWLVVVALACALLAAAATSPSTAAPPEETPAPL